MAGVGLATWSEGVASIGTSGRWQDLALLLASGLYIIVMVPALLAIGYPLAAGMSRTGQIPGRSLLLGTAELVTLPRPRFRLGLVAGVALTVGLAVLIVDRILPSGVAIGLYTGFGGALGSGFNSNNSAILAFLGTTFVLLSMVCVSVSALAGRPNSAGTGGLHGAAAGVLTGYLLAMVTVVRFLELCHAGTCEVNVLLRGIGSMMIVFTSATLAIAVLMAPFFAAIRLLVRLGRGVRPRWPAGVDPAPDQTHRRRMPVTVSAIVGAVVIATFVISVTSAAFLINGITNGVGGDVPAQILQASGPEPVGSVAVPDACAAVTDVTSGLLSSFYVQRNTAAFYVQRDTAARKATGTDDPAMRAMGKQVLADNRAGRINETDRDLDALSRYCVLSAPRIG